MTKPTTAARRHRLQLMLIALIALSALIAAAAQAAGPAAALLPAADGAGFESVTDPARAFFDDPRLGRQIDKRGAGLDALLDRVFTLEHDVPIGDGRTLFVTETFTLRAWLRFPRRAVLFLNGSAFNGDHFRVPAAGYDATALVAERRMFAYTVDFLGVRNSFKPADGRDADFQANVDAMRTLLRYIRFFRGVPRIDLVGEGYGGSVATQLAADPLRVRSVSMSAMLYREVIAGPLTDPLFVDLLRNSPDGYFFGPGEGSLIFLVGTPPAAVDFIVATQGGFYPTPNFLVATELPFFDPGVARVPGLVIRGSGEFIAGPTDGLDLAADYGSDGAQLVILDGAGHAPRLEGPEIAAAFWQATFDFIDP